MSRNKVYLSLLVASILAIIFYVSYGMLNIGKENKSYTVSVIVEDSSSDRWNAFKEGLSQGADGSNVYLNLVSTAKFSSLEEECSIVRRELDNGADGVIVEAAFSEDSDRKFYETVSEKPVILVENDMESEALYSTVMPDHFGMGKAAAEAVVEGEKGKLAGARIGIIGGNQKKFSMQQREKGFKDGILGTDSVIVWNILTDTSRCRELLREYMEAEPVDILVSLSNDTTELCIDYLLDHQDTDCRLYSEGCSEKTVYYLDKGMIQALIVPNEYYMGYQSMKLMLQKLEQYSTEIKNIEVDFLSVTKDTMYDENIGKILFPTVR
ncbi:MAG: substrate-binding domain-containing protein [Clostridia bacterium]|nr:substrate-binding domain-containing protein [Clostridia bacterium]MDY5555079.1 substrate-binding domain-containing protein [Blautia sp.]